VEEEHVFRVKETVRFAIELTVCENEARKDRTMRVINARQPHPLCIYSSGFCEGILIDQVSKLAWQQEEFGEIIRGGYAILRLLEAVFD